MNLLGLTLVAVWAIVAYLVLRAWHVRRLGRIRLAEQAEPPDGTAMRREGLVRRWLSLAGYRRPGTPALFAAASAIALLIGILIALLLRTTVVPSATRTASDIPGGVGELLAVLADFSPWMVLTAVAVMPILVVRRARRRRVAEIERDLPLVLDLFATLAQAGLGFDAALARIVESQSGERPLVSELVNFQRDLMGGVPRVQALRYLARRVDITSITIFVSAIIQAEHVGASISETLQHQADDVRVRRREQALLNAQALPVKLVFPLVACFLPGIFVSTLGPVLFQMVQVANSVLQSRGR